MGVSLLGGAVGCLDPTGSLASAGGNQTNFQISKRTWLYGLEAAALVSIDDLCPMNNGPGWDYGGNMTSSGVFMGLLINEVLAHYPRCKITSFGVANMQEDDRQGAGPAPLGTWQLRNHQDWVTWWLQLQGRFPQLTLGYHGWTHLNARTHDNTEFAYLGYPDDAAVVNALDSMVGEFAFVQMWPEKAFRPPAVAMPQPSQSTALLEFLARNEIVLCDHPTVSFTAAGAHHRPSWYQIPGSDLRVLRICIGADSDYITVLNSEGAWTQYHHFAGPSSSAIYRPGQMDIMKAAISNINDRWGDRVGWLSYGEMGQHFRRSDAVQWTAESHGSAVDIRTDRAAQDLVGVTWEFEVDVPTSVRVFDACGAEVVSRLVRSGSKSYVVALSDLVTCGMYDRKRGLLR